MKTLISIAIMSLCVSTHAVAADKENVLFILDASGSMWGQLENVPKISIAKKILFETITANKTKFDMGLMTYGHRRKSDCSDIEIIAPLGSSSADTIIKMAQKINPKGKTPIGSSVLQAAESLKYAQDKATIILISDGEETCGVDLCKLGTQLDSNGIDFTTHIIGFDLQKDKDNGLRCLAENTGGIYVAANDSAALKDALNNTVAVITEPEVVSESATIIAPDQVNAGNNFEVSWKAPGARYDKLVIKNDESIMLTYSSLYADKGTSILRAPEKPATYELHYLNSKKQVLAKKTFTVIDVKATLDTVDSIPGGNPLLVNWTGPGNKYDKIRILDESNKSVTANSSLTKEQKPVYLTTPEKPGIYTLQYYTGRKNILATTTFQVTQATATIKAPSSASGGDPILVEWTGPGNRYDKIRILDESNKSVTANSSLTKEQKPVYLTTPEKPGIYTLQYYTGRKNILATSTLEAIQATASFDMPKSVKVGTKFSINWQGPGNEYDKIYLKNEAEKTIFRSPRLTKKMKPLSVNAPREPGLYYITYKTGRSNILAKKPIIIVEN